MNFESKYINTMGLKENAMLEPLIKSTKEALKP